MRPFFPRLAVAVVTLAAFHHSEGALPNEPVAIGSTPQVLFDGYIVDNHWAIQYGKQIVRRVTHQPVRHSANPLIAGRGGYINVHHDPGAGVFRMWYQTYNPEGFKKPDQPKYGVAYAESKDGIEWQLPDLNLHDWPGGKEKNICWLAPGGRGASGGFVIDTATIPERDRRDFRYLMVYSDQRGLGLVGSKDGVHWDADSAMRLKHIHSDTYNNILYDAERDRYVMTLRPKDIYRKGRREMVDEGMSRRVARLVNKELWTDWDEQPQTLLIPDELDAEDNFTAFYGMGLTKADGLFWGFLWPFRFNDDIYTELVTSRDAEHYLRLPGNPRLIDLGKEGAWDDGMVFAGPRWIEVGNQWRLYYAGHDGPHGSRERTAGIGLASIRKHGFVSLLGPSRGGVVCTRRLIWPGGKLVLNANARHGDVTVRVSDATRKPLPEFDHADCVPFRGDNTDHVVEWKQGRMEDLAGREIRLEIFIQDAHLYSFRAAKGDVPDGRIEPDNPDTASPTLADMNYLAQPPTGGRELLRLSFNEGMGTPNDTHGNKVTLGDGRDESTFPRWVHDGKHGAAMAFGHTGGYLRVHKSPAYHPASGRIEAWFRLREDIQTRAASNWYLLNFYETSKLRAALTINRDDGRLRFFSMKKDDRTLEIRSDSGEWKAGRWYHVAVAFGPHGLRMYVDGQLQADTDPSSRGLDYLQAGSLYLGHTHPRFGPQYAFPGDLDEIRIFREQR